MVAPRPTPRTLLAALGLGRRASAKPAAPARQTRVTPAEGDALKAWLAHRARTLGG